MISIKLFGKLEVSGPAGPIDLASAKLTGLLAVLAVAGGKHVARERLAEMLWGSHFDEQARQNFRQALTRLRKLLGGDVIHADDQTVRLEPTSFCSDLQRIEGLSRDMSAAALAEAAGLGQEEFLAGLTIREAGFADWLAEERQRAMALVRGLTAAYGQSQAEAGQFDAALAAANTLARLDPFDEEGHRLHLRCLAGLGRRAEALKHHQVFVERLQAELGTQPDAETTALVQSLKAGAPAKQAAPEPSRPSLAVLPFASLGADADQGYFAEGIAEEVITALSRLHWLTVISRSSTFSIDRTLDARRAGEMFGVRYILEGSVRRAGNAVRISGHLVETATGASLWAGRFDGTLDNIFDLQDEVASKVVAALHPRLERAEIERSRRKPTASLDAYDYYLRGVAEVHRWTREGNREALKLFYRAIELDRRFGAAYGMAARTLSQRKTANWVEDEVRERAQAEGLASLAVEFGYDDAVALSTAGLALAFVVGRVRAGGDLIERALSLNPGLASAWMFSGWVRAWNGDADVAVAHIARAIALSPHDPYIASMRRATSFAHFIAGRYEEAIENAEAVATSSQNAGVADSSVAASAILLGRPDEARRAMQRLREAEPKLRLSNLRSRFPIVKDDDFHRFAQALRDAGLPE